MPRKRALIGKWAVTHSRVRKCRKGREFIYEGELAPKTTPARHHDSRCNSRMIMTGPARVRVRPDLGSPSIANHIWRFVMCMWNRGCSVGTIERDRVVAN